MIYQFNSQPPPKEGGQIILPLVIEDLKKRAVEGQKRYGTMLQSENGRDALIDAYEEALDLCMYLRQELERRK